MISHFDVILYLHLYFFQESYYALESNGHPYYFQDVNFNENNLILIICRSKENSENKAKLMGRMCCFGAIPGCPRCP